MPHTHGNSHSTFPLQPKTPADWPMHPLRSNRSFLPTRATAATEIPSHSLESSGETSPSFNGATAVAITAIARTNPAGAQEPINNYISALFIQPKKCFQLANFTTRRFGLLISFGYSSSVFPGVHPAHTCSSGTGIGSRFVEPRDRNDEPRRSGTHNRRAYLASPMLRGCDEELDIHQPL